MTTQPEVLALLDRLQPTAAFEPFRSRHHDVRPLGGGVDQTNTSWVMTVERLAARWWMEDQS